MCKLLINYTLQHIIGGDEPGFIDGTFKDARFHSPQGVAFRSPSVLYIVDTDNHAIREVTTQLAYIFQPFVEFIISGFSYTAVQVAFNFLCIQSVEKVSYKLNCVLREIQTVVLCCTVDILR